MPMNVTLSYACKIGFNICFQSGGGKQALQPNMHLDVYATADSSDETLIEKQLHI